MLYVTHGARGKGRWLFNCMFSVQLHHKTTYKILFKFCVMPGHSIIVLKITLLPCLSSVQTKKWTSLSSKCKLLFVYSTNGAKPHSCGSKDLTKLVPVVVWCRDNVKTKESSQTFILKIYAGTLFYPKTITFCHNIFYLNVPKWCTLQL